MKTASAEWKLRHKRGAAAVQERTFRHLTPRLAATGFWRDAGIEPRMPYERFRARVPLHGYEQLAPAVARMTRGESDVLWPGRCTLFALTAGTTTGLPRHIPVTEEMMAHVRRAGFDALLYYTVRVRHAGSMGGRHLLLGGATQLSALSAAKPHEIYAGELSGIAALNLPAWAERHLYEPGTAAAQIPDWDARLDAIVARTRPRDISLVAGLPSWLTVLAQALRGNRRSEGAGAGKLDTLWPNLECCVHTGMPLAPYHDQLRGAFGPAITFHEIYAASEAFIATQDADARHGLRLMGDMGVFFEFLPMAEFDETRLTQLGSKAVPLAGVKPGVDYALLLTTPGGFARYVLGDVVRFISTEPPRLIHVGGTSLRLNAFGEQVGEKDITDALVAVCQRHNWSIVNFHIAPLFAAAGMTGQQRGRHEWWVELKPGTVETPTGPQMAAELELEMQRLNETYAAKRKSGALDAPIVRLVMPGVFAHWLRFHNAWGGQKKIARCRSDRLIADELAQITNFARD